MRMTLTATLGLMWANRAECCQRKSGSQDYGVWWFPQEAKRTADKASCRGQTPVELQSLDNDNHNRASGILSQDVFVQLHLHSSSEVLPFFIRAKCLYIITIWAIENVFCVCIAWYKHQRGWGNSRQFVSGLHNYREFSQPLECLYQDMQTQEKKFSIAFMK